MGLLRDLLARLGPARDAKPEGEWYEGAKSGLTSCETFVSRRIAAAALHARNVDKQRRRLLAEKVDALLRKTDALTRASAHLERSYRQGNFNVPGAERVAKERVVLDTRSTKLRALAARLRGEK
jgi:hypothetical protein